MTRNAREPTEPFFTANEWRIMALTATGHMLCHMGELAYPAVLATVMVEFQLQADRAAALAVPGFLLFGVGAVPAGIWTDRRGSHYTMTAYFFLLGLAALTVYAARSLWGLVAALTFLGAAISIYHPAGLSMIAQGCRRRGRAMGINGVAGSLGVASGPAVALYLAAHHSWRDVYAILGVAGLTCGIASWLVPLELHRPEPTTSSAPSATSSGSLSVLVLLFAAMLVGGFNYRCLTTALPTFVSGPPPISGASAPEPQSATRQVTADHVADGATSRRAHLVFLVLALGGIGQIAGGYLADRFRPSAVYAIVILLTIPCALLMAHGQATAVVWGTILLVVFLFGQQPLENTMLAEATPLQWRSTVYGLKFIVVFGVGSLGAYATGIVWQVWGLPHVFDLFAGLALVMAGFAGLYYRRHR